LEDLREVASIGPNLLVAIGFVLIKVSALAKLAVCNVQVLVTTRITTIKPATAAY